MRTRKFFLQMTGIFFFILVITIIQPGFSIEAGKYTSRIEEFRLSILTEEKFKTIEELKLYIKNHESEIKQRLEGRKSLEQEIDRDTIKLKELEPTDVINIEISKMDFNNGQMRWVRQTPYKNPEIIKGFLSLCKKASNYEGSRSGSWFLDTNYILIVHLKNNETLEVPFFLSLTSPFGMKFESQELCEALCAMTNGFKGSMIHFDQEKIVNVTKLSATLQPNDGAIFEIILPIPQFKNILKMDDEGKLFLTIEKRLDGKVIMNETKPFHYGQAQIFNHDGPGHMIVYIERPSDEF